MDRLAIARTIVAVASAIIAYLLIQTEVLLPPVIKVILGAASVGLAVLSPQTIARQLPTGGTTLLALVVSIVLLFASATPALGFVHSVTLYENVLT